MSTNEHHTTPPDPSPEGLRRRSMPTSGPTASSSSSSANSTPPSPDSATISPTLAPVTPPFRPTFSRSSTESTSSGSPRFDLPEDEFFPSGFSLLELLNVFDAHLELFTRPLRRKSVTWREKADKLLDEAKTKGGANLKELKVKLLPDVPAFDLNFVGLEGERKVLSQRDRERLERKYKEVRERTRTSVAKLVVKWEEEKTVRLRDKISFVCGVMNVLISALLLGFHPTWIPAWYSVQMCFYAPMRVFTYKRKMYHYFLFDLCYFVNILCMSYLWLFPSSVFLFEACYGLTLGTLGITAIPLWRNSLVFHSLDKVISLAIHILPPFVFVVIRHFYPRDLAIERYPALAQLEHLQPWRTIWICMGVYLFWQLNYWYFVVQLRADKIKEGRATSFTFMINDKRRMVGKIAAKVPPSLRELAFMAGQAVYTFITLLIPVFVLYESKTWASAYLIWLFATSAWNGASFYMEVFARKFEKELLALRKEFDAQQALLNRYAANPSSSALNTPGVALVSDPMDRIGNGDVQEKLETERSGKGLGKVEEAEERGREGRDQGEGAMSTALGKVEKPV